MTGMKRGRTGESFAIVCTTPLVALYCSPQGGESIECKSSVAVVASRRCSSANRGVMSAWCADCPGGQH